MSSSTIILPGRPVLNRQFAEEMVGKPVKEYSTSAGSKPGDNLSGTLLALNVTDVDDCTHHLVLKSILPVVGDIEKNTLLSSKITAAGKYYPKEIAYYNRIRPLFEEVWKGNKDNTAFFADPKVYACVHDTGSEGLYDYLVMEDLRPQGYQMPDKNSGLSHDEFAETLKKFALLHATSYYVLNGTGQLSKKLRAVREDPLTLTNKHSWNLIEGFNQEAFFDGIVDNMIELVEESGQDEIAKKIQRVAKDGHRRLLMGVWNKTTDNGKYFRVFVHADLWTNNVLIKYGPDGKSVQDVKFIDFQMNHFGNIYEDLHYFVFTSTTADLRKAHLRSCLQVYYQEFEKTLQELGCDMPTGFTEESFLATFHETLDFGFVFNLMAIPYQLGTPLLLENQQNRQSNSLGNEFISTMQNESTEDLPSLQDMFNMKICKLKDSAKSSPIAVQRLTEMVNEMIELGVL